MTTTDKPNEIVTLVEEIKRYGFAFAVDGGNITLRKNIEKMDVKAYDKAKTKALWIFSKIPTTDPSTISGTDSPEGPYAGLGYGLMEIKKTGCNKNFLEIVVSLFDDKDKRVILDYSGSV